MKYWDIKPTPKGRLPQYYHWKNALASLGANLRPHTKIKVKFL